MIFLAMHIPDGFLSIPVVLVGWALLILMLSLTLHHLQDNIQPHQIPLMGVLAAFVFAAQMINFPVAGGTSGHLLGGMLVAILIGPWAAVLVMTCVVAVQALMFQDGGLLALGFNTFNMGILAIFLGYACYQALNRSMLGAFVGAWCGVEAAAIATSLELAASNTTSLGVTLPAMVGVHALIGIGEALITVAALRFIQQTRPDLLTGDVRASGARWVAIGLLLALSLAFISPLADSSPDGLEHVAEEQGFIENAESPPFEILPDYTVPVIHNEAATTIAAGILGVLMMAGVGFGMAHVNKRI